MNNELDEVRTRFICIAAPIHGSASSQVALVEFKHVTMLERLATTKTFTLPASRHGSHVVKVITSRRMSAASAIPQSMFKATSGCWNGINNSKPTSIIVRVALNKRSSLPGRSGCSTCDVSYISLACNFITASIILPKKNNARLRVL